MSSLMSSLIFTPNLLYFQGQAMAKIDIGNVLDSVGDSQGALDAYVESYRSGSFSFSLS